VPQLALFAADLVAVSLLVFALYLPRHGRRDLVVAFLVVNVGVLAVTAILSRSDVGAGLGLGLFGVLSIIRLRSTELAQQEVAYYFTALALALLGGIGSDDVALPLSLMVLILLVVYLGDHPRVSRRYRQQVIVLDAAVSDHEQLIERLAVLLGVRVHSVSVQRLDLVNDTTTVEVRYADPGAAKRAAAAAHLRAGAAR
jgi:hypothetical protein